MDQIQDAYGRYTREDIPGVYKLYTQLKSLSITWDLHGHNILLLLFIIVDLMCMSIVQ